MEKADILGRWEIVSWVQDYDDGRQISPLGEKLEGFIQYDSDRMICMLVAADRPAFTSGGQWDASDADKAGAYSSMLSYSGAYEIDGQNIHHHVDISLYPGWKGSTQTRRAELGKDGLLYLTARLEDGTTEARTAKLVWRRKRKRP